MRESRRNKAAERVQPQEAAARSQIDMLHDCDHVMKSTHTPCVSVCSMFADIRQFVTLYNDITPTVSKFWEGPGWCCACLIACLCCHRVSPGTAGTTVTRVLSLSHPCVSSLSLTRAALCSPVEMPSYNNALREAYSCVAGDVACNAAPAVPSPADSWSGTVNNP